MNNQYHPKHKIALVAVQNTGNRQAENDLPNKDVTNKELLTESVKAVTKERGAEGRSSQSSPEINYQKAAVDAIIKVKQDLTTKEVD